MKPLRLFSIAFFASLVGAVLYFSGTAPAEAAATLTQKIDPEVTTVGDYISVTYTVQNGTVAPIRLPYINGLLYLEGSVSTSATFTNGAFATENAQTFTLVPQHPGDFVVPAFDIHTEDGGTLHAHAMHVRVVPSGMAPAPVFVPATPHGAVMVPSPPTNVITPGLDAPPPDNPDANIKPPIDSDGRPTRVFMTITPATTDAYVGETIPLKIEFFIRADAYSQQDSLPTIKGSDFLMNDLSLRPTQDNLFLMNEAYHREAWVTAIAAVKSGDFPLVMERDTYWTKEPGGNGPASPLGGFLGAHSDLAHANISSNEWLIHSHALPEEGRPAGFTGAIGSFKAVGGASFLPVKVGDPVYLDFSVTGDGNFDHVQSPALTPNTDWRAYVASSKMRFDDESKTQGEKDFHQALIAKKNGILPLPQASFSYFDPTKKIYVTIALPLPSIPVTGEPQAAPAVLSAQDTAGGAAATPDRTSLAPNRLEFGSLHSSLRPIYHQAWFWLSQGAAFALLVATGLGLLLIVRRQRDQARLDQSLRRRSLQELEDEMSAAVRAGNALLFFPAARRAVQVHWAGVWRLSPEAVTLPVITARDPRLGIAAAPLFRQADEVLYSGSAPARIDLAELERLVREELLQAQPA